MITVKTIRRTHIIPLFWESKNKRSVKKYLELWQDLDNCEVGFLQTLSSIEGCSVGDSPTILHSVINISDLSAFEGDKEILKPLLEIALLNEIDEITF